MSTYTPIVTLLGQEQIADAIANEEAVNISHLAVGDGSGSPIVPLETMTTLVNEVWRGSVESAGRDPNDPTKVIFTATIPLDAGPFVIREIALFSSNGEMFAIGAYPEQFKPTAAQGAVSSIAVEFVVVVSETAQVTVAINPSSLVFLNNFARIPFYAVDGIENDPDPDPAIGDMVIVGGSPNGAFAGHARKFAQWNGSLWLVAHPPVGTVAGTPDGEYYRWTGSVWALFRAGHGAPGLLDLTDFAISLPIYPEVASADGKLSFTDNEDGTITIDEDQVIVWRGITRFNTSDFDAPARTLAHSANKTYHVRFHPPGHGDAANAENFPQGRFVIKDLAASGYNPTAEAETHSKFDTGYDDVLVARVVTNGANVPVYTGLENRAVLRADMVWAGDMATNSGDNNAWRLFTSTVNWARTPSVYPHLVFANINQTTVDRDLRLHPLAPTWVELPNTGNVLNRYTVAAEVMVDGAWNVDVRVRLEA